MSPLLLLLAVHHTVPVILQHRSGQGGKHKRGWEFRRTKKSIRSGAACHEGRWWHVGVVYRWAPSSLQFMLGAGERGTEPGEVSSHLMEYFAQINLFINLIPGISIIQCGSLSENPKQTNKNPEQNQGRRQIVPCTGPEVLCLKHSQGQPGLTLAQSFLALKWE